MTLGLETAQGRIFKYEERPIDYSKIATGSFYLNYNEFGVKKRCYSNLSALKIGLTENRYFKHNP